MPPPISPLFPPFLHLSLLCFLHSSISSLVPSIPPSPPLFPLFPHLLLCSLHSIISFVPCTPSIPFLPFPHLFLSSLYSFIFSPLSLANSWYNLDLGMALIESVSYAFLLHRCQECGESFRHKKLLKHHTNAVHRKFVYRCTECTYETHNPNLIRNHVVVVRTPSPSCPLADNLVRAKRGTSTLVNIYLVGVIFSM